jgi:hypothetical protein
VKGWRKVSGTGASQLQIIFPRGNITRHQIEYFYAANIFIVRCRIFSAAVLLAGKKYERNDCSRDGGDGRCRPACAG